MMTFIGPAATGSTSAPRAAARVEAWSRTKPAMWGPRSIAFSCFITTIKLGFVNQLNIVKSPNLSPKIVINIAKLFYNYSTSKYSSMRL